MYIWVGGLARILWIGPLLVFMREEVGPCSSIESNARLHQPAFSEEPWQYIFAIHIFLIYCISLVTYTSVQVKFFFVSPSSRMRWEAASDCVSQNVSRCQPCLPCSCVCICGMSLLCGSINGQEYIGNYTRHHIEHIWIIRESNNYSWIASVCCAKPQENMSAKCMTQRSLTFDIWEIRRPDKRLCISYDLELLPASKLEVGLA